MSQRNQNKAMTARNDSFEAIEDLSAVQGGCDRCSAELVRQGAVAGGRAGMLRTARGLKADF
jgi:hypothetical protein